MRNSGDILFRGAADQVWGLIRATPAEARMAHLREKKSRKC